MENPIHNTHDQLASKKGGEKEGGGGCRETGGPPETKKG